MPTQKYTFQESGCYFFSNLKSFSITVFNNIKDVLLRWSVISPILGNMEFYIAYAAMCLLFIVLENWYTTLLSKYCKYIYESFSIRNSRLSRILIGLHLHITKLCTEDVILLGLENQTAFDSALVKCLHPTKWC